MAASTAATWSPALPSPLLPLRGAPPPPPPPPYSSSYSLSYSGWPRALLGVARQHEHGSRGQEDRGKGTHGGLGLPVNHDIMMKAPGPIAPILQRQLHSACPPLPHLTHGMQS